MSFGAGDASGPVDWLTAGPPAGPPDRRRRRGVLAGVLLIAVAAGVLGPALWVRDRRDEPGPGSAPTPSSTLRSTRAPTSPASPVARPQVVYRSGPLLPGRTTDWELFARSEDTVYRIEVRAGRVTATQHGSLATSGPVTFVADAGGVILRPLDGVAGYAVPNGRSARPLRGLLSKGGYTVPGPAGRIWVASQQAGMGNPTTMRLVRFDGTATRVSVRAATGYFRSDGAGGLLLGDVGGEWEARPGGLRRVTTGAIAAVGPHHYVLVRCSARHTCHSSLYDREHRSSRRLAIRYSGRGMEGVVSPDGHFVAFFDYDGRVLEIVDLRSGKTRARVAGADGDQLEPRWSSDGRWLAGLVDGRLTFVDLRTGTSVTPPLRLPRLVQLTSRTDR